MYHLRLLGGGGRQGGAHLLIDREDTYMYICPCSYTRTHAHLRIDREDMYICSYTYTHAHLRIDREDGVELGDEIGVLHLHAQVRAVLS